MATRIILVVIILACVAGLLAAALTTDNKSLSQQETDQIRTSCANCHNNPYRLEDTNIHRKHFGANCISCHENNSGLEKASNTRDMIAWAGIGFTCSVLVVITINFIVVRKRLVFRKRTL